MNKEILFENFDLKEFANPDFSFWKKSVLKELKFTSEQDLTWKLFQNLELQPSYPESISHPFHTKTEGWKNCPQVNAKNENVKELIKQGAEALELKTGVFPLSILEEKIPFIIQASDSISIPSGNSVVHAPLYIKQHQSSQIKELIQSSDIIGDDNFIVPFFLSENLCTDIDPIAKNASLLSYAVNIIDVLTDKGFTPEQAFKKIGFSLNGTPHFFIDIARLRSLRFLWAELLKLYKVNQTSLYIQYTSTLTEPNNNADHQLISNTLQAIAGITGGADFITLPATTESHPKSDFYNRISSNINLILKHESFLDKNEDFAAGSFYIEHITREISVKAWEEFLKLEKTANPFKGIL